MQEQPQAVLATATQLGYDPLRWAWAESSVWTARNDHRCAAVPDGS